MCCDLVPFCEGIGRELAPNEMDFGGQRPCRGVKYFCSRGCAPWSGSRLRTALGAILFFPRRPSLGQRKTPLVRLKTKSLSLLRCPLAGSPTALPPRGCDPLSAMCVEDGSTVTRKDIAPVGPPERHPGQAIVLCFAAPPAPWSNRPTLRLNLHPRSSQRAPARFYA